MRHLNVRHLTLVAVSRASRPLRDVAIRGVLAALVLSGGLNVTAAADTTPTWVKLVTIDFDPRAAGTVIVDLKAAQGQFREIRFRTDQPVEFTTVTLVEGSDMTTLNGGVSSKPGAMSSIVYVGFPRFVDRLSATWNAFHGATAAATLEVWGKQTDTDAAAIRRAPP
jgi:hypothetical protein